MNVPHGSMLLQYMLWDDQGYRAMKARIDEWAAKDTSIRHSITVGGVGIKLRRGESNTVRHSNAGHEAWRAERMRRCNRLGRGGHVVFCSLSSRSF